MQNKGGLDANGKELRYQDATYWKDGQIVDVAGVLRNEIIVKAMRVAKEIEGVRRSFVAKRRIVKKAA